MSAALEALIRLVEEKQIKGFHVITGYGADNPQNQDYVELKFNNNDIIVIRGDYQYDEGGRSFLVINEENLPDNLNIRIGEIH